MEKYFTTALMLFGLVGGAITGMLGGFDVLTHAIVVMVVVDYLTGIGKAFANRKVVRADEAEFQAKVYQIEDNLLAQ